jgi:hypothetical protein
MTTKENLLKIALGSLAESGMQTTEAVESLIDGLLQLVPHLKVHRKELIDEALSRVIISVGKSESMVDDEENVRWINKEFTDKWVHWPWLKKYLDEEVRRPVKVMNELDESTNEVIDLLGEPTREGIWDRRGLIVGHVQSGKTQHYTALVSKALDAGFKLIIILSGIHENLRQQTQERIEAMIIGKNSRNSFSHFGVRLWSHKILQLQIEGYPKQALPDITTLTSVEGDYGAAVNSQTHVALGQAPVILVVKKNASILRNILNWVGSVNNGAPLNVPTLVIDDEADHSSVNTAVADPETDPTTINRLIRKLLWRCDKVGFVGYTATPYANIFMDQNHVDKRADRNPDDEGSDLFPKSFIINLDSPTNYIGPEAVFGHSGDENLGIPQRAPLPMHEPADDADIWLPPKHDKYQTVSPDLPKSLREALRSFLLGVAARIALGHDTAHMSMLVHVSRFNDVQQQVTSHVENELSSLIEKLRHGEQADRNIDELREIWERVFVNSFPAFAAHPSQQLVKPVLPDWLSVSEKIQEAFGRIKFCNINSTTKENLDYAEKPNGLIVVAVGGDRLSRGLTLEGLSVSYFLRGAKAYDTLMQMGRWFGYRPGYAHLCRVYAPTSIVQSFKTIALATEELRSEFRRMAFLNKRPTEYGLRVSEPRADLLVTAMNKMRLGQSVRVHFSESLVSSLDIPRSVSNNNYEAFVNLVDFLEKNIGVPVTGTLMASGEEGSYHYRWESVGAEPVLDFLKRYCANVHVCFESTVNESTMIAAFIESMNRKSELTEWTIALISSKKLAELAITGRQYHAVKRNIDTTKKTNRPNQYTFKGVAMGQDEAIDLTSTEFAAALEDNRQSDGRLSKAGAYRMQRSPKRGLLLLYPIIPQKLGADFDASKPIIGVAVSFPASNNDTGQDYVCNPRKIEEMFGAEFAEDFERDVNEGESMTQ